MTNTGLRIYTAVIALICGAAIVWSIHQSTLAASWQADSRSWHRVAATTVAHDRGTAVQMQQLVVRYNRLVKRTRRSQRRLLADVRKLQSTGGTPAVATQPSGYVAPSSSPGSTPSARSRHRAGSGRRAGTLATRHPHQLMRPTAPATTDAWEWPRPVRPGGCCTPVASAAALAAAVSRAVEQDEARWSRFRPDSEVSRMNRAGGRPVPVSAETLELLEAASIGRGAPRACSSRSSAACWPHGDIAAASSNRRRTPRRPGPATARRPHRPEPSSWHRPDSTPVPGSTWVASPRAGSEQRVGALVASRCDDPAVLVDAGGDLVAVTRRPLRGGRGSHRPTGALRSRSHIC